MCSDPSASHWHAYLHAFGMSMHMHLHTHVQAHSDTCVDMFVGEGADMHVVIAVEMRVGLCVDISACVQT